MDEKEMYEEQIAALKRSNHSYKSANTVMKGKLKEAESLNLHYITENARLKEKIRQTEEKIEQISLHATKLGEIVQSRNQKIQELRDDYEVVRANLEWYRSLPWYKRIFQR